MKSYKEKRQFMKSLGAFHKDAITEQVIAILIVVFMMICSSFPAELIGYLRENGFGRIVLLPFMLFLFPMPGLLFLKPYRNYRENEENKSVMESLKYLPIEYKDVFLYKLFYLVKVYLIIAGLCLVRQCGFGIWHFEWNEFFYILGWYFLYPLVVSGAITIFSDYIVIGQIGVFKKIPMYIYAIAVLVIMVIVWVMQSDKIFPQNPNVTIGNMEKRISEENSSVDVMPNYENWRDYMTSSYENEHIVPGLYSYRIETGENFAELFRFEEWEETDNISKGECRVTVVLQEGWEIDLYSNGLAYISDDYGGMTSVNSAYYRVPEGMVEELIAYMTEHITTRQEYWDKESGKIEAKFMNVGVEEFVSITKYSQGTESLAEVTERGFLRYLYEVSEKEYDAKRTDGSIGTEMVEYGADDYLEYSKLSGNDVYVVEIAKDAVVQYSLYDKMKNEDMFLYMIPELAYYGVGVREDDGSITYYTFEIPQLLETEW